MKGCGIGDIYGQQCGPSTIGRTYMAEAFRKDRFMHEGGMFELPVTPSVAGGVSVGQFTFPQLTVGLLALLGLIWYADRKA